MSVEITRNEAEEVRQELSPDSRFRVYNFLVMTGPSFPFPFADAANKALKEAGRPERWRTIGKEDMDEVYAEGIWSPERAKSLIDDHCQKGKNLRNVHAFSDRTTIDFWMDPEVLEILKKARILKERKNFRGRFEVKTTLPSRLLMSVYADLRTQGGVGDVNLLLTIREGLLKTPRDRGSQSSL